MSNALAKANLAFVSLVTVAFLYVTMPASAHSEPIVACYKVELPGKEHTLNPHAPKADQRQETGLVCEKVELPKSQVQGKMDPVIDRLHDHRTVA